MQPRHPLALVAVAALTVLGSAAAAEVTGTAGADRLRGTERADVIDGRAGHDHIEGRGGWDRLRGGPGRDTVHGHGGGDRIAVHADGARDTVTCGPGFDTVNAELADVVAPDCELVARQLSRDTLTASAGQHETQVEPDSLAVGSTVVTAFQSGRMQQGGAAGIGWATSRDAGATWVSGHLERVTERASDPVVAYDAVRRTWLIATLGADESAGGLYLSRSPDGVVWSRPQPAVIRPEERYDKEWLACDNWPTSPRSGTCYLSYLDAETVEIRTRRSIDGGRTWSGPAGVRAPGTGQPNGAFPVVRPDGTLLVVFRVIAVSSSDRDAIVVARSTDGAVSFAEPVVLAERFEEQIVGVRAPVLPSADVDAAGRVYVVWGDCRFAVDCFANDIVLATSSDGVRWTPPERIPFPAGPDLDWFVPGLSVAPGTSGARARLAVAAYGMRKAYGCRDCERLDVYAITSRDGGRTWSTARRLNAEAMEAAWAPETSLGRMFADYVSTSYAGGRPLAVVSIAAPRVGDGYRQAIFSAALPP
jgi:hypothetical protein